MSDRTLSNDTISRLAECFATMTPGQLAALDDVRSAALRGSSVAMNGQARARLQSGMTALNKIIEATGGRR